MKKQNFTQIDNAFFRGKAISPHAKGVGGYLLGLPKNWQLNVKAVAMELGTTIYTIRKALKELENAGYFSSQQVRDAQGKLRTIQFQITDTPEKILPDGLKKPPTAEPSTAKRTVLNTELINTELINNTNSTNTHTELKPNSELTAPVCADESKTLQEGLESIINDGLVGMDRVKQEELIQAASWASKHPFWSTRITNKSALLKNWKPSKSFYQQYQQAVKDEKHQGNQRKLSKREQAEANYLAKCAQRDQTNNAKLESD